ncbi:hypothetical protein HQ38_02015 [Porphyromonas crevioricanis]|uniref:Uncharacterized protein n=1 Tax=Porphyromonas crevioricanis TaxID=393921 RepID=A0AB34PHW7_9PORP|nr:hypothetical protein HQ38_02015 [Porphyromonas crevioricanis]
MISAFNYCGDTWPVPDCKYTLYQWCSINYYYLWRDVRQVFYALLHVKPVLGVLLAGSHLIFHKKILF